ncbi:SDR family NAD(P)-dependent oxidoreductase [Actinomadura gamaensis]|uniref:SDR family NAD(P)-dependent oxidoreductase n=1 Tax=Actinomadura gamaensis TaxID=1763541 RepID=A0ABV9U3I2_9ACTN
MEDKIALVTGATSGIGKETARELARRGFRVGIVARNPTRAERAVAELAESVPGAIFDLFPADLSALEDVRHVAERVHAAYGSLDVLVNNAGVHLPRAKTSADGYDRMIATNHLGPFLLTELLLGPLEKAGCAGGARVVTVASEAHRHAGRLDPDRFAEPTPYGPSGSFRVYARSKLLNILFTQELAARLDGTGVTANAVCPGMAATGLVRDLPGTGRVAGLLSHTPALRTPAQAARVVVRVATDAEFATRTGEFITSTPGLRFLPRSGPLKDETLRRAVWDRSSALVGLPTR